jgi:hypothetical protein
LIGGVSFAKSGGSFNSGVSGPSTPEQSTTSIPPEASIPANELRTLAEVIVFSLLSG